MIGADILDKTNTNAFQFGRLREEPTWWELEPAQRIHFDEVQRLNQYLREEYHQLQVGLVLHVVVSVTGSVQDVLWTSGYSKLYADLPARQLVPDSEHDACRVHGSLNLNKVTIQ